MDRKVFIIGGVTLIILLCAYIFMQNNRITYNWAENYRLDSKHPYGLHITNELLQSYNVEGHELTALAFENLDSTATGQNYIAIDNAVFYDSLELSQLLQFVKNGNTAFISTKSVPIALIQNIYPEICDDHSWTYYLYANDSLSTLNVSHANLSDSMGFGYRFFYFDKPKNYNWHYIDPDYFCDAPYSLENLGNIDEYYPNFARKSFGEGYFYLHTTPLAFTNIQMLDEQGLAYASKVFTHLLPGKIWIDDKHGISESLSRRINDELDYLDDRVSEGPLQFIMRNNSLKWAWFLLLAAGLLFLLFRTKRRQRVIPILEANKNSSLEFISTIGSLHFLQKENNRLAQQMGQLFFSYIREHYDLPTHQPNEQFVDRLHGKSQIEKTELRKIINFIKGISINYDLSDYRLIELHRLLSHFYKNCK